jgi:hypothetical protein
VQFYGLADFLLDKLFFRYDFQGGIDTHSCLAHLNPNDASSSLTFDTLMRCLSLLAFSLLAALFDGLICASVPASKTRTFYLTDPPRSRLL